MYQSCFMELADSLQVPAKESSAAVGISLLFCISQIHFWCLWSWKHKGSSLGALSKSSLGLYHWDFVPAMGLSLVMSLCLFSTCVEICDETAGEWWVQVSLTTCSFSMGWLQASKLGVSPPPLSQRLILCFSLHPLAKKTLSHVKTHSILQFCSLECYDASLKYQLC